MSEPHDRTRILTWNLERKRPDSALGAQALTHLHSLDPDVMSLTEARTTMPNRGGHLLWCEPPRGAHFAPDERKVLLWSKNEWTDVDRIGIDSLDRTRFISGVTDTPHGPLRVLGVCIPWQMAEVVHHFGVKRKPWALHMAYLELLTELLKSHEGPIIVAGDFNQCTPRVKYGHRAASEALDDAFATLDIVTAGQLPECSKPGIDHIALGGGLRADKTWGWPNKIDGNRLSDHDGAGIDLG